MFICHICDKKFKSISGLGTHIGMKHKDISKEEYYMKYIDTTATGICPICKTRPLKFISIGSGFSNTCKECSTVKKDKNYFVSIYGEKEGKKKYEEYRKNIENRYTKEWYIEKYGEDEGIKKYKEKCEKSSVNLKNLQKKYGERDGLEKWKEINNKRNFSNSKEGLIKNYGKEKAEDICKKFSLTLDNFQKKYGEREGQIKWNEYINNQKKSSPRCIEYWINKGYNKKEAKKMVSNHQKTFSLDICIEKYGEDEGYKIWKKRQNKWQSTLDNKSDEEKERIYRAKMFNGKSYSNISQKMFWDIYNKVQENFDNIYFATLDSNKTEDYSGHNHEYMIHRSDGKLAFLDFYIKDNNKVIEFNGNYWYGGSIGNRERDMIREEKIIEENPSLQILYIWENDYKNNPEKTIKKCKEFLYG